MTMQSQKTNLVEVRWKWKWKLWSNRTKQKNLQAKTVWHWAKTEGKKQLNGSVIRGCMWTAQTKKWKYILTLMWKETFVQNSFVQH